ncbi:MAG: RNA polymerase sigma factor [Desulfobulbaceae bacterium]|nr:RNA polymerase sigma factor [Desulfobulbaceae bacterium]
MSVSLSDSDALREQIVHLLPRLLSFAKGLSGDRSTAEDLVQEACERALTRLGHVQDVSGLDSWLFRIVYTGWIDTLRRRKRRADGVQFDEEIALTLVPVQSGIEESSTLDVQKAVDQLSPDFRAAILLISVAGYNYDEAAEIMEVPVGTVASRVARARVQLAQLLSPDETGT